MLRCFFCGILVACLLFGCAIQRQIPATTLEEIAKDLARLQQEIQAVQTAEKPVDSESLLRVFTVTIKNAPVRGGASDIAPVMFTASAGTDLPIIDKVTDWYSVKGPYSQIGWIKATDGITQLSKDQQQAPRPKEESGLLENTFRRLTDSAARLREKYATNQYIMVKGFTVKMSLPPSLDLNFEFR